MIQVGKLADANVMEVCNDKQKYSPDNDNEKTGGERPLEALLEYILKL